MTNTLKPPRRAFLKMAGGSMLVLGAENIFAQDPDLTRIICGSPPGSVLDAFCRRVADSIQPSYTRNAIVENRTGGSGQIAVAAVKAAAPDGLTVLVTPMPQMGIFPHSYKKLPYDPVADFAPVAMGATFDLAFAVGPVVPASVKTMNDFLTWCKTNPTRAHFGSPAAGSTPHFVGSMAARTAGVEVTHIPYRGPTPAILDMVGGQISAACSTVGDFMPFAEAGKCRIIATTGKARSRFAPNVPTFLEQGFKDIVLNDWFAFFIPVKTPKAQAEKLNTVLKTALASPEVVKAMSDKGLIATWSTPTELSARLTGDLEKWAPIVRSFGFTADT
jgi:tripartite-type tricarboxylate transporter receptor subunit TctC